LVLKGSAWIRSSLKIAANGNVEVQDASQAMVRRTPSNPAQRWVRSQPEVSRWIADLQNLADALSDKDKRRLVRNSP
jgi:hypothetical protein